MYYLRNLGTEQETFDFTPRIGNLKTITFWQLTFKHCNFFLVMVLLLRDGIKLKNTGMPHLF